ncbi:MAG: D-alanyl-D-alanine carboxypeptidase family protein [Clostridia bacterium]|nr:D-alanyl-D-alanine carboxypeptidase family protein [Clostridia bacterium]
MSFIKCRRVLAALLMVMLLLPLFTAGAESTAEATEQPTPAVTHTPAELQAQGIFTVGASGDEVTRLQQRLKDLGYLNGKVDGKYGGGTKRAVISFQRRNGLKTDGVAGETTLAKLYADDAVAAPENTEPVNVLTGEVPMLVNADHPVDEYFVPADLVNLKDVLDKKLVTIKYKKTQGVRTAVEALQTMLETAKEDKITKWQISAGYRTWDDQVKLLNAKISSYRKKNKDWSSSKARRAALKSVAEPGCSEHHLGLAFDINVKGAKTFSSTKQYKWLKENCWDYGFIMRYTKEKEKITGFTAEAWHIRYVGVNHAKYMQEHDLCLEEYIEGLEEGKIRIPSETEKTEEDPDEKAGDGEAAEEAEEIPEEEPEADADGDEEGEGV